MSGAKFKIGDRVIHTYDNLRGEIVKCHDDRATPLNLYNVVRLDPYGFPIKEVVSENYLILDVQYYRDKKINEILNEI